MGLVHAEDTREMVFESVEELKPVS